jgi:hypothetical protein
MNEVSEILSQNLIMPHICYNIGKLRLLLHLIEFLRTLENVRKKGIIFPQQNDLDSATEGLIRVHDAYDLDVKKVRFFFFLKKTTVCLICMD